MYNELNEIKEEKDKREILELAEAIATLRIQKCIPSKEGMIQALTKAQNIARDEIQQEEFKDGDTIPMLWCQFAKQDLYRKLSQYEKALYNKAIKKLGKSAFENLIKESFKDENSV